MNVKSWSNCLQNVYLLSILKIAYYWDACDTQLSNIYVNLLRLDKALSETSTGPQLRTYK